MSRNPYVRPLSKRIDKMCDGRVYLNTKVGSLTEVDDKIEVTFEGPGKFGHEQYDRVLVSIGSAARHSPTTCGSRATQHRLSDDRR